jgi:hypothetical protein
MGITAKIRNRVLAGGVAALAVTAAVVTLSGSASAGGLAPSGTAQNIPANGKCGPDLLGTYVKFTVPAGNGVIVANPTAAAPAAATVNQDAPNKEFTILSASFNGSPALIAEVIGGAASLNPKWTLSPPTLAPTPVLDVTSSNNFSQFSLCLINAGSFTLNKTVNSGSGSFTFTVTCVGRNGTVLATKSVTLAAGAGAPATSVVFPTVPLGATCTATETAAVPALYTNDGPKGALIATTAGAAVTINNTRIIDNLRVVKTIPVLSLSATSGTFSITVTNLGNRTATGVVVTDVVPSPLVITGTSGPGTWSAPTWTIGSLAAGASVTLNITVTVPLEVGVAYPPSAPVENCAAVVLTQTDIDLTNNNSCVTVTRA